MTEDEKKEFKADIVKQVSGIVSKQSKANNDAWIHFNEELRIRLEKTLPAILKEATPKTNYWFSLLNSVLNGAVVGISIYVAMILL